MHSNMATAIRTVAVVAMDTRTGVVAEEAMDTRKEEELWTVTGTATTTTTTDTRMRIR